MPPAGVSLFAVHLLLEWAFFICGGDGVVLEGIFPFQRNAVCGGSECCRNPHPDCWVKPYTHHRFCLAASTLAFNQLQEHHGSSLYSVDWEPLGAAPQLDVAFQRIAEQDFLGRSDCCSS